MGRKRRHSPEPFLVFFGPITRKEIEVRRKLGLFENPDKEINMDDLDSDFWDYYHADENDENLNITAGVRKSPMTHKLVGNTLHLSLLNERDKRKTEISSSKKARVSKSSILSDGENAPMPGILTESISNQTPNSEKSLNIQKTHYPLNDGDENMNRKRRAKVFIQKTHYPLNDDVENMNRKRIAKVLGESSIVSSKTSLRSSRSSKVNTQDVNESHMPTLENVMSRLILPERSSRHLSNTRSSDVNHVSAVGAGMVESNDGHQIPATSENGLIEDSRPGGRSSRRLSKIRSSDVNHVSAVDSDMVESNDGHQMPATPETDLIEDSRPPGRSSRRLSKIRSSDVNHVSAVSADMVESNDGHQIQAIPENVLNKDSRPPGRSSRRLSKTRLSDVNHVSAVGADMVESSDGHQIPSTPETDLIEDSIPPGRSSRPLSKIRSSDVNHVSAVSADMVEINDGHQIPAIPENGLIEDSIPPGRSTRRLSKTQSSDVNHVSAVSAAVVESNDVPQISSTPGNVLMNRSLSSPQSSSKANSVLSSIKKKSQIPVSSKCRDIILRNIRNAGTVKTPRAGTPEVRKMSSIPHSATKLLLKATNVKNSIQNTPQGIKTPLAQQSSFSVNKNNRSKLWQRNSVKTPVTKGTPMVFNSAVKSIKAPFSTRPQTTGQDTPLSAIKRIYKTPQLKKLKPSDTPVSTLNTLYRTPKPQTLETPDTPLSAIKTIIYKTPSFKPTDVFNVGSSNKNSKVNPILSTPASTLRNVPSKLGKKDTISKIATSPIKLCLGKKDLGINDSQQKSNVTPKTDNWEVNVVASTSKMHTESVSSRSVSPKKSKSGLGIKYRKTPGARFSSKTPHSIKRLTPKRCSIGRPPRRTPNKKSSTDSFVTPDSFENSKNYSFTPDVPKVKTNFLKAPKLLVNGKEINDVNWTNKLNPKKVIQAKRPNYMYSPASLNKKPI